jgi:hypothetical protein
MIVLITMAVLACNSSNTNSGNREGIAELPAPVSQDSLISRGRYLVTIMGCNDCHSPKRMGPQGPEIDSTRMLSGHPANMTVDSVPKGALKSWILFNQNLTAFVGPWGTSFAANLTSDATGIGSWTAEQFFTAMRYGKYKGLQNARPLLPPMPWQMYRNASDEDLKAIFAYLKSTPPVQNNVPSNILPEQFSKLN